MDAKLLRFDDIVIGTDQLWRDGQVVKVTPKSFQVITYFVRRGDDLVSDDDFWRAVWHDPRAGGVVNVAPNTCFKAVDRANGVLGPMPDGGLYIRREVRRGWRFCGKVYPVSSPTISHRARDRWDRRLTDGLPSGYVFKRAEDLRLLDWMRHNLGHDVPSPLPDVALTDSLGAVLTRRARDKWDRRRLDLTPPPRGRRRAEDVRRFA